MGSSFQYSVALQPGSGRRVAESRTTPTMAPCPRTGCESGRRGIAYAEGRCDRSALSARHANTVTAATSAMNGRTGRINVRTGICKPPVVEALIRRPECGFGTPSSRTGCVTGLRKPMRRRPPPCCAGPQHGTACACPATSYGSTATTVVRGWGMDRQILGVTVLSTKTACSARPAVSSTCPVVTGKRGAACTGDRALDWTGRADWGLPNDCALAVS